MSKLITREAPARAPASAAPTTPPAGPERRLSFARYSPAETRPPALVMTWRVASSGSATPTRSRYSPITGPR